MKLSFIWYLNFFKQFVNSERASEVFSSATKTLSLSLSKSVQVGHFYRELYNRNWRNSMIKIRIQFSCVKLKCLIRIDFLWRKDHIYTRHCSKQTSNGLRPRAVLKTSGIVFPNTDRPRRANNIYMCTWNRTESYWPCEVHVYWSACFFNWKTKIQRITIPLPWYLWFIGFRLTTICFTQGWTLPWKKTKSRSWRYRCEPTKVISSSVN